MHAWARARAHSLSRSPALFLSLSHTHKYTLTHTYTHTHIHTHTYTHRWWNCWKMKRWHTNSTFLTMPSTAPWPTPSLPVCVTTLQHTATHCNTLQHTATHCISTISSTARWATRTSELSWNGLFVEIEWYGVATISRLLQIIGLFCKRAL